MYEVSYLEWKNWQVRSIDIYNIKVQVSLFNMKLNFIPFIISHAPPIFHSFDFSKIEAQLCVLQLKQIVKTYLKFVQLLSNISRVSLFRLSPSQISISSRFIKGFNDMIWNRSEHLVTIQVKYLCLINIIYLWNSFIADIGLPSNVEFQQWGCVHQ